MSFSNSNIHHLKLRVFITEFRRESIAVWLLCFYILMEYIRPQNMYPVINILPWGMLSLIGCSLVAIIEKKRKPIPTVIDHFFVVFSFIVFISMLLAWDPSLSWKHWTTYASWILLYFCTISILNTPKRMLLFIIFFLLINFKMSQHGSRTFAMRGFSFASYGLSGSPGWFHNSGELALQMVVVFSLASALLLALKKHFENQKRWFLLMMLFPGTAALTVIGSSSRGGQLALAVVIFFLFMKRKHFVRNVLVICFIGYIATSFLPETQKARFSTMGEDPTSQLRLMHWKHARETIKDNPWGIGYKNWPGYYPQHFDVQVVEQIHNTSLEAFVDLGYVGGALFHLALVATLFANAKTRKEMRSLNSPEGDTMAAIAQGLNLALIGTFIAAFFMSVLWYPMFWFSFAMTSALRKISTKMAAPKNSQVKSL